MTGLLLKDMYIMLKQTKFFLVLVVILAFLPHDFMYVYALFYAALLPVTALAYDERAKWDKYVNMMPYTVNKIIGSKYVMGYLSVTFVVFLTCLGKLLAAAAGFGMPVLEDWIGLALIACITLTLLAVNLPLMFWIGTEKGRILFVMLSVCSIVGVTSLFESIDFSVMHVALPAMLLGAAALMVVMNAISFQIAKMLYKCPK